MTERRLTNASACRASAPVRHQYSARLAEASARLDRIGTLVA
jgi:hypothetical protein